MVLLLGMRLGLGAGYLGGGADGRYRWRTSPFPGRHRYYPCRPLGVCRSMLAGMVAFGVLVGPGLIRVVWSATLPVREELYIQAAQVSGLSGPYILTRHVFPRISGAVSCRPLSWRLSR